MRVELPVWQSANVLVVGDVMLDRYWHGGTSRISPEAPVPVVHVQQIEERIGGAGNVALNVASLGGNVGVLGVIGHDEAGQVLTQRLEDAGVRSLLVKEEGYPTITKLRVMSRHQQLIRLDFEESSERVPMLPLLDRLREHIQQTDVVVLSDYGKGALRECRQLIEVARAAGKWVLVDPKSKDFNHYRGANLITPNYSEFEAVSGVVVAKRKLSTKAWLCCVT